MGAYLHIWTNQKVKTSKLGLILWRNTMPYTFPKYNLYLHESDWMSNIHPCRGWCWGHFSDSGLLCSSATDWGRGLDAEHQLWSSVWRESLGGKEPRMLPTNTVKDTLVSMQWNNQTKLSNDIFVKAFYSKSFLLIKWFCPMQIKWEDLQNRYCIL